MKRIILTLALAIGIGLPTMLSAQNNTDEDQIKSVIDKAYIEGIHNLGDLEEIRKGFHPGFDLLIMRNNLLSKLPIYTWLETTERRKAENPNGPEHKTTVKYLMIDIVETAAIAKIELYREDKLQFTDYLSLYKFNEGWRIVSKIYQQH
ncbi:MAG: hypothetical protein FD170_175 [Bacteroidetes bacterium]|nr:MAG: hypothetical protein FD170_175 [Bacteroidota bacterium]